MKLCSFPHSQNIQTSAMHYKLITAAQVARLRQGDILQKFPLDGHSETIFDEHDTGLSEAYEIRCINADNQMIELVMTPGSRIQFASPADVGRMFIKSGYLVTESVWWM